MHGSSQPQPADDLLPLVADSMRRHGSVLPGEALVVAVSGGPDSVTLLDLLQRLSIDWRLTLHVAHLNHGLRGDDADGDAAFVRAMAEGLGLPFHGDRVDTADLARRLGRSVEDAARHARLGFLDRVRRETGAQRVALGHTRSDQAETVLMRLLRGAGAGGLAGIRPVRDGVWVRPMLGVSRAQVARYVAWRDLPTRSDDSNQDHAYLRNRIRHDLLPLLERDYAPGIERVLSRTAEVLCDEDAFLESLTSRYLQKALIYRGKRKIVLDDTTLFRYHISIRRRLFRNALTSLGVAGNGLSFSSIRRLCETQLRARASVQIVPGVRASRCGAGLILSRATPSFSVPVSVPGRTSIPQLDMAVVTRLRTAAEVREGVHTIGAFRACFDVHALPGELVVRNRRPGDRIRPFGMAGTRKVSDLLIDEKVPKALRDEVPVLVCGDSVLWLAGVRRSSAGGVGALSRDVVEIAIEGNGCRLCRFRS